MDRRFEDNVKVNRLTQYAQLLWHWAWLLALSALVAGGIVFWFFSRQTPVYQATASVMIDVAPASSQSITYTNITTSQELAATYANLMTMTPILEETAKRLKLTEFPPAASVQVKPIQNTQLMTVTVNDTNRSRVALLCNTIVQVFADQLKADQASKYADSKKSLEAQLASLDQQIQSTSDAMNKLGSGSADQAKKDQLETTLTQYRQSYASVLQSYEQIKLAETQSSSGIILKQPARTPDAPIKPKPLLNGVLAALAGLMLAIGIIFLTDYMDDTVRDPEEILQKWGVPVLGTIISYSHSKNELITSQEPRSPIAEAFRSLRTNLQFANAGAPARTILVTSPAPEDGKTTVAANLANVIAHGGQKVVLVDGDLRKPRVHQAFQMTNHIGLTEQFLPSADGFDGVLKATKTEGLNIITAGKIPPNPAELLGSEKMTTILGKLSAQFDTTIVDTPPLLLVTDALALAPHVDGMILVLKPSATKRVILKNVLMQLKQLNVKLIGVVLNNVNVKRSSYHYYNYAGTYYSKKYAKGYEDVDGEETSADHKNHHKKSSSKKWMEKKGFFDFLNRRNGHHETERG